MKNNNGIATLIAVLIVAGILALGGGGYYVVKKLWTPAVQPEIAQNKILTQPTQDEAASMTQKTDAQTIKNYSISQCGVELAVKTNQAVTIKNIKTERDNGDIMQLYVGEPLPNSVLEIECQTKNKNPQTDAEKFANSVQNIFYITSNMSGEVNKNDYSVFDEQTLSLIKKLYWATGSGGYKEGSETIGFENQDWIYLFSFLNPEQAKNQDSFVISVR